MFTCSLGFTFLSQYGWYILILAVVSLYLWNKYKANYYNWKKKREEQLEEQHFGKPLSECYYPSPTHSVYEEYCSCHVSHAYCFHNTWLMIVRCLLILFCYFAVFADS